MLLIWESPFDQSPIKKFDCKCRILANKAVVIIFWLKRHSIVNSNPHLTKTRDWYNSGFKLLMKGSNKAHLANHLSLKPTCDKKILLHTHGADLYTPQPLLIYPRISLNLYKIGQKLLFISTCHNSSPECWFPTNQLNVSKSNSRRNEHLKH